MELIDRRSQIADMILNCEDFKELSSRRDVYCPFEALSVSRLEIRHSNFLADILNPLRPHGFGDSILCAFLEWLLAEANEQKLLLDIHFDDVSQAQVLREWKHIDLLIRLPREADRPELVFAVEIKVEAREGAGQLERYEAAVEAAWPDAKRLYFYLTPEGREASRTNWIATSFGDLISCFEQILETSPGVPEARMMLHSYNSMMRRRYVSDDDLDAMVQKVWSKHRDILEFLIEQQPNPASEFAEKLAASDTIKFFNDELSELGVKIQPDRCSGRFVTYVIEPWEQYVDILAGDPKWSMKGHILKVEMEISKFVIAIRLVLGRGEQASRERIFQALLDGKAPMNLRRKTPTKEFTRMASKTLRNTKRMESILDEGFEEKDFTKLRQEVVGYLKKVLPEFNTVLENSNLERSALQTHHQADGIVKENG
jgi:hypothetical protein